MKRSILLLAGLALLAAGFGGAAAAYAAPSPSNTVQEVVSEVRAAVAKNEGTMEPDVLDEKLRGIIAPVFDFRTMARSSLAQHWRTASAEQQKEFVDLFSDLLARNYLKKIRDNVAQSDVELVDEKVKGKKAIVRTMVQYDKDQTAGIDYRLRMKGGNWLVYDVIIENIGLVSNYRNEFAGIVKNEKVEGLLERLRNKQVGQAPAGE